MSQSRGVFLPGTSNRIFDCVVPVKIRIHLWMGRLRIKPGGNNKQQLPTAEHFVKFAAVRGAGGLLGPFHPALTSFREGGCPVCPQRTGVPAWVLLSCHSWGTRIKTPGVLSSCIPLRWDDESPCTLLWLCMFPNKSGVNRARQTVILVSWQWLLWLTSWRVQVQFLWKTIIKKREFLLQKKVLIETY